MTTTQDSTEDWLDECINNFEYWKYIKMGGVRATPNMDKMLDREQVKAKIRQHMLSEALDIIGADEKEFTKRSRPNDNSDTDKLWDLANGVEPISSSQFSTWGSSANAQFRKFALKLRDTTWKEAELHKNELRAELRKAFTEKYS